MNDALDMLSLRQTLGWSQLEMATYLGLDRSTVSRLENGRSLKKPVYELLRRLTDAPPGDGTSGLRMPLRPGAR